MVHIQQCHLMPREQQICEQLASPLLYLFPLVPALSITSVLLPVSNSYLTDSHWKRSAPRSTPTLQLTSLPHSTSLSTQLKTNSAKSTPTPSRTEPSVQSFNPFKGRQITTLNHSPISHSRSLLSKTATCIDRTVA